MPKLNPYNPSDLEDTIEELQEQLKEMRAGAGCEAETLRAKFEHLASQLEDAHDYLDGDDVATDIRRVLDYVDAADSLHFLEHRDSISIDMLIYCPTCGEQHIDRPVPDQGWHNPPHRSHLCAYCGTVWRHADIPTNGVELIASRGKKDTWTRTEAASPTWVDLSSTVSDLNTIQGEMERLQHCIERVNWRLACETAKAKTNPAG